MVEFRYNIKTLFPQPIVRVTSNLLPHTFRGDRREALDAAVKMSEIIDRLGQLSAVAQKLNRPVTTSQRVRMSENQTVYLLADVEGGQYGVVLGLLKVGTKDLYLFDETGETRKVESAPCILDFYIHESRQRAGLGKKLFQTMLAEEKWTPLKCCVDRPSEKLLGFLRKHYSLQKSIPQANNFVVYQGFFNGGGGGGGDERNSKLNTNGMHNKTDSPNTQLFGNTYLGEDINKRKHRQVDTPSNVQVNSPAGRYGARRPTCSMAESRKNPLDALSRMSLRHQTVERRSGLQDVDDEYFKKNVFSKSVFPKHSGLNETYAAAGQSPLAATESTYKLHTGGDAQMHTMSQAQIQQQQQQQQQMLQQQQMQQQQTQSQLNVQAQAQMNAQAQSQGGNAQMPNKMPSNIIHSNSVPNKAVQDASSITLAIGDDTNAKVDGLTKEFSSMQTLSGDLDEERQLLSDQEPDDDAAEEEEEEEAHDQRPHVEVEEVAKQHYATGGRAMVSRHHQQKAEYISSPPTGEHVSTDSIGGGVGIGIRKPTTFQLSKQHTGMKNISYGVGQAVAPTNKMEFDQEASEEFGIVKINRPLAKGSLHDTTDTVSSVSSSAAAATAEGLTDQGYYDLKFYHNKLW